MSVGVVQVWHCLITVLGLKLNPAGQGPFCEKFVCVTVDCQGSKGKYPYADSTGNWLVVPSLVLVLYVVQFIVI